MAQDQVELQGVPVQTAFDRVRRSVAAHGWRVLEEDPARYHLRARTSGNFLSWGEEVTTDVRQIAGGSVVVAESHPIAQVLDYGRSTKNVGTIIAEVAR